MKLINFFQQFYVLIDLYKVDLKDIARFKDSSFENYFMTIIKDISDIHKLQSSIRERGSKYKHIVEERLISGNFLCFCFIEKSSGKVANTRWLKKGSFYHDRFKRKIELKNNEAFTMDSYTLIKFRGMGLHKEMNKRMLIYCREYLKLKKVYMVIFRGRQYRHLHKIVRQLGYKPVQSNFYFSLSPLKTILDTITK